MNKQVIKKLKGQKDTYCINTTMLWTLILGMVQKALVKTQRRKPLHGYNVIFTIFSLCNLYAKLYRHIWKVLCFYITLIISCLEKV